MYVSAREKITFNDVRMSDVITIAVVLTAVFVSKSFDSLNL
jgi:hypothetical protein